MKSALLLPLLLSACAIPIVLPVPQSRLAEPTLPGSWQVVEITGERTGHTPPTLTFDTERRYHAETGCNTLFGSYTLAADYRLSFSDPAATRMACPNMRHENLMAAALPQVQYYRLVGNGIELLDAEQQPLLRALPK